MFICFVFGYSATGFFPYGEEFFPGQQVFSLHLWGFFPWVLVPKLTSCGVQVEFYFYRIFVFTFSCVLWYGFECDVVRT